MILTILAIYILSFLRMYFWIRNAHSKDGIWSSLEPDIESFIFTAVPLANTIASILVTTVSWNGKKNKPLNFFKLNFSKLNFSKFFNIKK
jgi:hypothetical protein